MAREEPCEVERHLDQGREEGLGNPVRHARRSARDRALLRLDRRATRPVRRRVLHPALHAAARAESLVEDQQGQGERTDRVGRDATGRPLRGRARPSRRSVGRGIQLTQEHRDPRGARTRAFARNAKARKVFETLDSRNRYAVLYRIEGAKKPETRERLAKKFVAMLAKGETIYPRPERKGALADRDAFEHRGAHAALRELGEERLRVDERAEAVHARLVHRAGRGRRRAAPRRRRAPRRPRPPCVRRRRTRRSRGRRPAGPTPRRAPRPTRRRHRSGGATTCASAVRRASTLMRGTLGNASTSSAPPPVTRLQSRPPIGSGNHTSVSPCGCSSRQLPSCHDRTDARRACRTAATLLGPAQPTRATRISSTRVEHVAGVRPPTRRRDPARSRSRARSSPRRPSRSVAGRGSLRSRRGRRRSTRTARPP